MKKSFITLGISFLLCAHSTFAQTKDNNVGDIHLSVESMGFLFNIDDISPGGLITSIGYEKYIPMLYSAIEPHVGYSLLGSGKKKNPTNDEILFPQFYHANMVVYGISHKFFIRSHSDDALFSVVLENDFSFANIHAKIQDKGMTREQLRKEHINGKFFYAFRLGLDFRIPDKKPLSGIRVWAGATSLNLTDFLNQHLPAGRKAFSSQYAPLTVGISLLLF